MSHQPPFLESTQQEYVLPSTDAVLAGTLALMTGHAQSQHAEHRGLMAKKIRSNLHFLVQHPGLRVEFREVLKRMQNAWEALTRCAPTQTPQTPEKAQDTHAGQTAQTPQTPPPCTPPTQPTACASQAKPAPVVARLVPLPANRTLH